MGGQPDLAKAAYTQLLREYPVGAAGHGFVWAGLPVVCLHEIGLFLGQVQKQCGVARVTEAPNGVLLQAAPKDSQGFRRQVSREQVPVRFLA